MKVRYLFSALALSAACSVFADECQVPMGIAPVQSGDVVPDAISRKLEAKLRTAITANGVAAGEGDCQFFLMGRFDHAYTEHGAGPGGRTMVKTDLQLAIVDLDNQKVFATSTFPLKGVGSTDEQALTRALTSLNPRNPEFISFVADGRKKIVDYFDANYQQYLNKARQALKARDYDEALYWSTAVPECCKGASEANALTLSVFTDKVNYEGASLLAKAEGEWAQDPTSAGAGKAYSYLSQIDPAAACYPQAQALGKKIAAAVKSDHDFETRQKYNDRVSLERQRIEAARQAAVTYAKNQPKKVVVNNWHWW